MEVSFSAVDSCGSNSFITMPAKKPPKIVSAPTCSAIMTKVKIKKKAKRISNWVVALVTLLNQIKGCLKRYNRKMAANSNKTNNHNWLALPPLMEAYTVKPNIGTISPNTAVSRIVCPIGLLKISFSLRVAITTPNATVENRIVANRGSLNRPATFKA